MNKLANRHQQIIGFLLVAIALAALPWVAGLIGNSWVRILNIALLYVMLALGLNIVVGFAGLLDLGYIAFYAVGAYVYGLLASPHLTDNFETIAALFPDGLHLSIWLMIPLGALTAALFGVLLGAPTLRLRGDYLAIVTLGFGEIIRLFLNNLNAPVNITNGPQGINMIEPVQIAGVRFSRTVDLFGIEVPALHLYYYLFLALTLLIILVCMRLQNSRIGRAWTAIRDDEIAAKSMGINTRNMKLLAFALGASFGGVAGAMFSAFQGFVSPESFGLMESIIVLCMVVLGGMGHVPGVILGALLLAGFPEMLRQVVTPVQEFLFGTVLVDAEILRSLIYGLTMVLVMLYRPNGLWPQRK
ncbi:MULTISPECIES: ABC transporter permease subunit [unclassified Limnobacter]|jgi:branched-chain amino acid transport system permease protein|uniref:ABC transporter permease subunit n=1 Tax=unclassified Limnobacter TaxID=2630203 RepID=UPI000C61FD61|nr:MULTISPECIES: ABC transporter ATP-binding protein [unclassified Limnobacter]MAG80708.1 ABC transporter ATP-binding protein [Sutterellaceae bacterium]MBT83584.1 ABC transporter ATP-binding protein [Sutterellaceae bacterium]MDZ4049736.1 ABC transporter ATP-binding protein [Limnobacter sp.]HAV73384.1 ABC transporter ATP-binding protein [Limnobacter sp.]|tara:strand:+ start:9394 stop:10467 length:1074 start_codon:yes stop_codon:yes gene_type:complete